MILLIFLIVLCFPLWSEAATYYVATTGSDANSCATAQTIGTPKLTIASGLGCLAAGDTLYIRTGTYTEQLLETSFGASGSAGSIITVSNYNGETVTLRPSGSQGNVVRFQDATKHHITINGLILDGVNIGGQSGGSVVYCQSNNITLSGNDLKNGDGNGILCDGDSYQFLNNRIFTNGLYTGYTNSNGMYLEGITNSTVSGNEVYDNECYGIRVWNSGASPKADNNTIEKNIVHGNGFGRGLSGASACGTNGGGFSSGDTDNIWRNNVLYDNYVAIQPAGSALRAKIYNNTLYHNDYDVIIDSGATNTEVKNVIMHNAVSGSGITDNGTGTTTATNLTTNPTFVNAAGADFHLQSSSAAKDAGTMLASVPTDKDGVSRPQGSAYDIGAYEYVSATRKQHPFTRRR